MEREARCPYCAEALPSGPRWEPRPGRRTAYDPYLGRLWHVCPSCRRWNLAPMEDRWETLEAYEVAVRESGRLILSTRHLSLIDLGRGEVVRVGRTPRIEFAGWRYGTTLPGALPPRRFWERLLLSLPAPPPDGYDPYFGSLGPRLLGHWITSPFQESAAALTYLFSQVPLAPTCPACRRPLGLRPWEFHRLRWSRGPEQWSVSVTCGLCASEVSVFLSEARPSLRLALSVAVPPPQVRRLAESAARLVEEEGGPTGLLDRLGTTGRALGELTPESRVALMIALDEQAEAEALEGEWKEAEEIARIADGELTSVPGFEEFRRRVLDSAT